MWAAGQQQTPSVVRARSKPGARRQMAILEKMQFGRVKLEDGRTMMAVAGQPTEVEIGPLNIKNS